MFIHLITKKRIFFQRVVLSGFLFCFLFDAKTRKRVTHLIWPKFI